MDCRQAQLLIPLWVGRDLSTDVNEDELLGHVAQCPACRQQQARLNVSQQVLLESRQVTDLRPMSLWPRVSAQLAAWDQQTPLARFNVWFPTVATALAASLLIAVTVVEIRQRSHDWSRNALAADSIETRNLFDSDPAFQADLDNSPTSQDFQRWQNRRPTLQPARASIPMEW